jgi:hypothetical protein
MYLSRTFRFLNILKIFTGVTSVGRKFILLDRINFLLIKAPQIFNPLESNLTFSQNMVKFL